MYKPASFLRFKHLFTTSSRRSSRCRHTLPPYADCSPEVKDLHGKFTAEVEGKRTVPLSLLRNIRDECQSRQDLEVAFGVLQDYRIHAISSRSSSISNITGLRTEVVLCKNVNVKSRSTFASPSSRSRTLLHHKLNQTFVVSQRHFASGTKDDDDDGVEARLMRNDENTEGFLHGPSYSMSFNFDDYRDEQSFEQFNEELGEKSPDSLQARDVEGESSEGESGDDLNDPSDEEFEGGEKTDEELDELLASTPLFDPPEFEEPGGPVREFSFRPEGPVYYPGMEYEPEDLDVTRPLPPRKWEPREKEAFTVQDVIDKADFRNVRWLTKFITETGTIIARKEFKMRTKSHNRITKAIKTARFFGLIPYTNMGRPKYVFNEPFDEMSGFYETDEEEGNYTDNEGFESRSRGNNTRDGRFARRFPQRPPGGFTPSGLGRRRF